MTAQRSGKKIASPFAGLHPDDVITFAEQSLQRDFTNLLRPYNSYINRVFELEDRDGKGVIIKFYRPGRWSKEAIEEEHVFLRELQEREIPVIAPLILASGETLGYGQGIYFALFPKCGGRSLDEFSDDQWHELGRLVGRMHAVGSIRPALNREKMIPSSTTLRHLSYLREKKLVDPATEKEFFSLADRLIKEIDHRFTSVPIQRIHGDLHFSNIIHRPGESFYLIDFDDMVMGPQIQDVWMLLHGYGEDSLIELDLFLEGYDAFHHFDRRTCSLIEPLRAMRYIHYLAWCGYQVVEDGKTEVLPDFGSFQFWCNEITEMRDQLERIATAVNPFAHL
jgi:Ser/Thr protein kinase RdoA (MazF antagonist)